MFFQNHYQNGYVTGSMDHALPVFTSQFGVTEWIMFDPAEIGPRRYRARMALGWRPPAGADRAAQRRLWIGVEKGPR